MRCTIFFRASVAASASGSGTGVPITGSTTSRNFAGCAVDKKQ